MSSAASLNLGRSQNGVLGNGLRHTGPDLMYKFDDILKVSQMSKDVIDMVENTVGKGENARFPSFSPFFNNVFKRLSLQIRK